MRSIGLIQLSNRLWSDVGELERVEPFATEIDVVSRVQEGAAQVLLERDTRPREPLRQLAFVWPFARHHVEHFTVDQPPVRAAADRAAVHVLVDERAVQQRARNCEAGTQ